MRGANAPNSGGGDWMRGENNPRWDGGRTYSEKTRSEFIGEIAQWRRRVYDRDRYTCRRCNVSPQGRSQLRAHHLAPWAKNHDLRFDLDNGVTLCRECHAWVHSKANADKEFLV